MVIDVHLFFIRIKSYLISYLMFMSKILKTRSVTKTVIIKSVKEKDKWSVEWIVRKIKSPVLGTVVLTIVFKHWVTRNSLWRPILFFTRNVHITRIEILTIVKDMYLLFFWDKYTTDIDMILKLRGRIRI